MKLILYALLAGVYVGIIQLLPMKLILYALLAGVYVGIIQHGSQFYW
jgi:xanthosine utilization system XapX-like protein